MNHYLKQLLIAFSLVIVLKAHSQTAPKPYGAIPSARQLAWQEKEMYVIMHFTPTTFQNKEWGFGDAEPAIFNPVRFNADKIVSAIKAGGFKGLTLVAKHHDGFALWPTKTTTYNISASPFRNGKGDLVKEMMESTKKAGIAFGLYCSPWDRNNSNYSRPAYISDVYYPQLNELYSNYGPLFTVFFDGANGGDGYYGGSREKRSIDASAYYNFEKIWAMVRTRQPGAAIFSDIGPDIRWVGNEKGEAAETSWSTLTPESPVAGKEPSPGFVVAKALPGGTRDGKFWIPAECDVPLRPGWFYHPEQDEQTKTPAQLLDLYFKSVGRSAALDLGISPMPSGELHPNDVEHLRLFGELLKKTFSVNYAAGAQITASNIRAKNAVFSPKNLIDNDRYSYWATDDSVTTPELVLELKKAGSFNIVRLRENIKLGQRIEALAVDAWVNHQWKEIATATSIGGNRLIRLPNYVNTNKVRLRIVKSPVCIALSDFALFAEPLESIQSLAGNKTENKISRKNWIVLNSNATAAIDNDPSSFMTFSENHAAQITVDLQALHTLNGLEYLPRQDGQKQGMIDQYRYESSLDGKHFTVIAEGEFSNIVNNPVLQVSSLKSPVKARYVRLIAKRTVDGGLPTIAELGIR